jgi:hypothetical protein
MKNRIENNMQHNTCIPKETMAGYINDTLDKKSFLNVSAHLEGCEYCSEAYHGLKQIGDFSALNALPALWQKRTGIKSANTSFIVSKLTWTVMSIVIIISGILIFNKNNSDTKDQHSLSKPENFLIGLNAPPEEENETNDSKNNREKAAIAAHESISGEQGEIKMEELEIPNKIPEKEAFALNGNYTPEINVSTYHRSAVSEIIYLENLKTINYSKRYSKSQSRLDGILTHVIAPYENKEQQDKKLAESQKNNYAITYEKALSNGLKNYNKGLFQQAVNDFDIILRQFPKDLNCKFYKALCYESTGKYSEAEKLFSETMHDADDSFFEEAKWHLALSKIGLEENSEAKNILKQIISDNGFYKSKAEAILKELK